MFNKKDDFLNGLLAAAATPLGGAWSRMRASLQSLTLRLVAATQPRSGSK